MGKFTKEESELIDELYKRATTINEEDMKSDSSRANWSFYDHPYFPTSPKIYEEDDLSVDEVNSPPHYKVIGELEAIDIIRELLGPEQFIAYCYGNVLKYSLRAKKKEAFGKDIGKIKKYCKFILGEDKE